MAQNVRLNQGPRCNSKSCSGESVGQNGASLSGITASHASFDPSAKQVPPELIGGKILWAHPDGYFLNASGNKLEHTYSPCEQRYTKGSCYPSMRHFGSKSCHSLMCITFHGPRRQGYECDHLNGVITDYRASNLQWVPPAENRRRAKILRAMRAAGLEPSTYSRDELLAIFGKYDVGYPHAVMLQDMTHHMEY